MSTSIISIGNPTTALSNTTVTTSLTAVSSPYPFSNGVNPVIITIGESDVTGKEEASLQVNGKLLLNGDNLHDRLERIETLLNIPTRDVTMESKYPKLKKLWEEYNKELAKYRTWEGLKGE